MPATYEPIATTTLGSAASTITFSSIPATYTDLRVVFIGVRNATGSQNLQMRLNGNTSTLYSYTFLDGNGSSASSAANSTQTEIDFTYLTNFNSTTAPYFATADIFSYAGSTNKTALLTISNDKNGTGNATRGVGLFRSTSAITSVSLFTTLNTMPIGTTATLYGILKA